MGLDAELTVILHEIVQFLENLRDANLSSTMETVRTNLLLRSKNALSVFTKTESTTTSSSAEPYLRMSASSKGLLPLNTEETNNELDLPEYVGAEETIHQNDKPHNSLIHPDYYEIFQSIVEDDKKKELEESQDNALVNIYSSLSASQAKTLVGSHLLIYGNERDNKPYVVKAVRGYSGRPAPNIVPRDQRRSEAAFEIFKPGNKTLQFIARTPKDMEQWVAKICQVGCCETNHLDYEIDTEKDLSFLSSSVIFGKTDEIIAKDRLLDSTKLQTTFLNINENKTVEPDNETKVQITNDNFSPPPPPSLPARKPRMLPSLPSSNTVSSYEMMEDEEDDIYHKIEDLGDDGKYYQNNVPKNLKETKLITNSKEVPITSYDDVHAILQNELQTNMKSKSKRKNLFNIIQNEVVTLDETYDDINTSPVIKDKNNSEFIQRDFTDANESQSSVTQKTTNLISYDNLETLANAASDNKLKDTKNNDEVQKKTPTKKSFLDRMRNKKESPQKKEKIITAKRDILTPPAPPLQIIRPEETTTYEEVSNLIIKETSTSNETSEYICPPAPRPLYDKPPTIIVPVEEEFYDDVNGCNEKINKQIQSNIQRLDNEISDDDEHYKLPRNDTRQLISSSQTEDEIYDDVNILANFIARQKELSEDNKDQDDNFKGSTSPDKKSWNRFNKKHRSNDSIGSGINKRTSNEITDTDCIEEQQQNCSKMNTFQKLINKMENSLGKVSPKAVPTTSVNKSYGLNTST
ncbi:hypothetical protein M0802_009677 [Mischocyttarus mexicanus]|nr:hypothetical protein M0802_009677 [Mischocyttarus mexicanus]